MPSVELVFLTGLIIGWGSLTTWAHYRITQIAASQLAGKVEELNLALGEAMTLVGSGMPQENPIVSIISKALEKQFDSPIRGHVIEQDAQGKFVKKNE